MSSKRHVRRKREAKLHRGCDGKNKYPSQTEAVKRLIDRKEHGVLFIATYRCPLCGFWHIGHRA